MTNSKQPQNLLGADLPADRGITGLGLIMELAGSIMLAYGIFMALEPVFMSQAEGQRWQLFLIGVSSAIRSAIHKGAGHSLLYGSPKGNLHGLKVYIGFGLGQSLLVTGLLRYMDMPTKFALYIFLLLAAWPVALGIMMLQDRFRSAEVDIAKPEDMGFESAATLMVVLGAIGFAFTALVLTSILKASGMSLSQTPVLMTVAVLGMLLVRSALHVRAGLRGTQGAHTDASTEAATQYINFGVLTAVVTGAVVMLQMLTLGAGAIRMELFVVVGLISYLLLIWPTTLRSFLTERNFSIVLDEKIVPRRAPDLGLTALGWLLFGLGVMGVSGAAGRFLVQDAAMFQLFAELGGNTAHSQWWDLGISGLQLYAGFELTRMGNAHRFAASAYAVIAGGIQCYLWWPFLKNLESPSLLISPLSSMQYVQFTMSITVAITTLILVNRQRDPDAKARIVA